MKYLLIFIIVLGSPSVFGQKGTFTIKGHSDLPERVIYIESFNGALGLDIQSDSISVNPKGEFSFTYDLQQPEIINLVYGKKTLRLFIKPTSSITLNLTDSEPVITGPMSIYANYFIDSRKKSNQLFQEYEKRNPGYSTDPGTDKYFKITDSILQEELHYLNSYFTKSDLPEVKQFIETEKASMLYQDLYYKVQSADTAYKKIKFFQEKLHFTSLSTYGFSDKISMDERELLPLSSYQNFVSSALAFISRRLITEQGLTFSFHLWMDKQMDLLDELSHDPYCNFNNKAIIINQFIKQIRMNGIIKWSGKLYSLIIQLQPSDKENILIGMKEKLDLLVMENTLSRGAPSPAFRFTDSIGNVYKQDDFKGKKVYMDVWATWCKPCIELQPAWDKLVDIYADKDSVLFVSVSMDQTKDQWLKYLKKHKLSGLLLYAGDGGWESDFAINYEIKGIPRFILLDENGKILASHAPRPDEIEKLEIILRAK